jgi:hypothetical protein
VLSWTHLMDNQYVKVSGTVKSRRALDGKCVHCAVYVTFVPLSLPHLACLSSKNIILRSTTYHIEVTRCFYPSCTIE